MLSGNRSKIFVMLFIMLGCLPVISAASLSRDENGSQDEFQFNPQLARAGDAFTSLTDSFACKDSGEPIYPDYYCGAWLDEDEKTLVIGLTEISDEITKRYSKTIGSEYDNVRYVKMTYSRNELKRALEAAAAAIEKELHITVTARTISDMENIGIIGVLREEDCAAIRSSGIINGLPVVVECIPPVKLC